jgi:SAM-dependent methyltransferase
LAFSALTVAVAPILMPSEALLALHDRHERFSSFAEFLPLLPERLKEGCLLAGAADVIRTLGMIEPLSGRHIPPEEILISPPNYRESILAEGCLSRNRASLKVLESLYGSLEVLASKRIYLAEAITGFSIWMRRHLPQLTLSEYLTDAEAYQDSEIPHQDLTALTFADRSFDLVVCNELFEHISHLPMALCEAKRVLAPGGRLISTFPMAFGQEATIEKARMAVESGAVEFIGEPDFHGDPIRPGHGSVVFQIPGWEILTMARAVGFSHVVMHLITSWKQGVLGGDLAGVLVLEAQA